MSRKIFSLLFVVLGIAALGLFSGVNSTSAKTLSIFGGQMSSGITEQYIDTHSQNEALFSEPLTCSTKGIGSDSCFKVDSNTEEQAFWYAEGCINNGTCTGGIYASTAFTSGHNSFLLSDTKTDDEFGGMQYIYAENYDIEFDGIEGWIAKFTKKADANSTQKYYWIVLPAEAYATGFGETYVATFENLSEPVYFITYDTHQCGHQSADYCGKANADPNGVKIGPEFFGAFTKDAGNYAEAARIAGKLTSFCRISGRGDITAAESAENLGTVSKGNPHPTSSSDASDEVLPSASAQVIVDKARELAHPESDRDKSITKDGAGGVPTDAFKEAAAEAGTDPESDDCLNFVQTVVISSGADTDFVTGDVDEMAVVKYLDSSDKWNEIETSSESDLQPGDILVSAEDRHPGYNHILIYLGNGKVAQANYTEWYGRIDSIDDAWCTSWGGTEAFHCVTNPFKIYRLGSGNCTTFEGEYPEYSQCGDSRWSDQYYGRCTFCACSCGASSMAMLATVAAGKDIFPTDIADLTKSTNYYYDTTGPGMAALDKIVGEHYGFEVETVSYSSLSDAEDKLRDYLKRGYMAHLSGAGSPPFSSGGHYIGIFSIDNDDNVMTANSSRGLGGNTKMSLHSLVQAGMHGGAFSAIKGNGGGDCSDMCTPEEDSGMTEGGLSVAAAEKLAAYYNEGGGTLCGGGQRNNCYAFSMWWVCNFTDVVAEGVNACGGIVATGDQVVPNCLSSSEHFGLPMGDYNEPRPYAVFSTTAGGVMNGGIHTGVVTHVYEDGTIDFIDAWYPSTNNPSGKMASLFTNITPIGPTSYAYLEDHVDISKLKEIVGE